jgi:hypothetical protein
MTNTATLLPTTMTGLLGSHSLCRNPIQEVEEEQEEEEEEDKQEEEGAIASPSATGSIARRRDLTTTTTMTNTATLLPTTMTAIAIAAPTPPGPPPTVIQPMLTLTPNDNLPCNINVPTSSHLQSEFQVRDGRINEHQDRINTLERTVEEMSAQLNIF